MKKEYELPQPGKGYVPPFKRAGFQATAQAPMVSAATKRASEDATTLRSCGFEKGNNNDDWYSFGGTLRANDPEYPPGYPHIHLRRNATNELQFVSFSYGDEKIFAKKIVTNGMLAKEYQSTMQEVRERFGENFAQDLDELLPRFGLNPK